MEIDSMGRQVVWMPEIPAEELERAEKLIQWAFANYNPDDDDDLVEESQYEPPQFLEEWQYETPQFLCPQEVEETPIHPTSIVHYYPSTFLDTSAPTCVSRGEYISLKRLANVDPRAFYIINPATGLPDEAFKASIIDRYRGIVDDDEAFGGSLLKRPREDIGNAHEVLPGASVLKRFREELGKSSERESGLERFREELRESSESASVLKRFRK